MNFETEINEIVYQGMKEGYKMALDDVTRLINATSIDSKNKDYILKELNDSYSLFCNRELMIMLSSE